MDDKLNEIGAWSPWALSFGREGYTMKVWKIATQWSDDTLDGVVSQALARVRSEREKEAAARKGGGA